MKRLTSAAAAAFAVLLLALPADAAIATAKVAQGALQGQVAGAVVSFKGVPFAAPPVGDLRWRPPQPAKPWSGVRDATAYGHACMQMGQARAGGAITPSEDCLTLNFWTPADFRAGQKRPVMVWIHGGAFIQGAGSSPFYDGTHFAEQGVVLVTVNYRLGRLGFFAHPALEAEHPGEPQGDYGLMDNIAALKWVRTNIAAFGGDPGNVTIFGESAGGILVNFLMTAPQAKGLFAKAISESGFGRSAGVPIRGDAPRTAEKIATAYAASVGVAGSGPDAARALRALSAEQLSTPVSGLGDPGIPSPIVDGTIIPEPPPEAFAKGHEAKVPYIAGGNSWEASLFPQVAKEPEPVLARLGPARERVMAAYGGDAASVAQDLTTETTVIEPDRHLARLHTRNGQKAWTYYFSYVPQAQRASVKGTAHGGEIVYAFGNLRDTPLAVGTRTVPAATPEDRKISAAMHASWVAFAKSSDPDSAGGPKWPVFDSTEPALEFGADGVTVRPQFHKQTLDIAETIANVQAARK